MGSTRHRPHGGQKLAQGTTFSAVQSLDDNAVAQAELADSLTKLLSSSKWPLRKTDGTRASPQSRILLMAAHPSANCTRFRELLKTKHGPVMRLSGCCASGSARGTERGHGGRYSGLQGRGISSAFAATTPAPSGPLSPQ